MPSIPAAVCGRIYFRRKNHLFFLRRPSPPAVFLSPCAQATTLPRSMNFLRPSSPYGVCAPLWPSLKGNEPNRSFQEHREMTVAPQIPPAFFRPQAGIPLVAVCLRRGNTMLDPQIDGRYCPREEADCAAWCLFVLPLQTPHGSTLSQGLLDYV